MTRLEFLNWLKSRPHGETWEWDERITVSGDKFCSVTSGEFIIQATSWELVKQDLEELGLA